MAVSIKHAMCLKFRIMEKDEAYALGKMQNLFVPAILYEANFIGV